VKFHVILRRDLENARSPFRVVQSNGREVEWVNRLLDADSGEENSLSVAM